MKSSMCTGIDNNSLMTHRLSEDKKGYYIPPYRKNEPELVVDSAGQEIARFENKKDALQVVEIHNKTVNE